MVAVKCRLSKFCEVRVRCKALNFFLCGDSAIYDYEMLYGSSEMQCL